MQSVLVIVALLAILGLVIGGTWLWLAKAMKDAPSDIPVLGDNSSKKAAKTK